MNFLINCCTAFSCVDELESQRHDLTKENALLFTVYLRRSRAVPPDMDTREKIIDAQRAAQLAQQLRAQGALVDLEALRDVPVIV